MRITREPLTVLLNALLAPAALLVAFALAWQALSMLNFGYSWLYGLLDIDAHIERYGPENRYRPGFQSTTDAERIALFGDIVDAVNRGGEGLRKLRYRPVGFETDIALLRAPEIEHLTLVSRLVRGVQIAGIVAAVSLAVLLAVLVKRGVAPRALATGVGASLALVTLLGLAAFDAGDGGWFARLHEWVFPPGHQWFFYYQESLMTTLMKAPDLFGPMAAELGVLTALLFGLIVLACHRLLSRRR